MYGNMKAKLNRKILACQFWQKQLVIEVKYTDFWNSSSYSNRILKILFFWDIWYLSWQNFTQQFHCFMHFPLLLWKESKFVLFICSNSLSSCHLLCRKKGLCCISVCIWLCMQLYFSFSRCILGLEEFFWWKGRFLSQNVFISQKASIPVG